MFKIKFYCTVFTINRCSITDLYFIIKHICSKIFSFCKICRINCIFNLDKWDSLVPYFVLIFVIGVFDEIVKICDHIIFNSYNQFAKYKDSVKKAGISCGIRVNPQFSTQEGHEIYDPCALGSRLGVTIEQWKKQMDDELISLLDGIHFHTLCEQDSDALEETLTAVEEKFGTYLKQME